MVSKTKCGLQKYTDRCSDTLTNGTATLAAGSTSTSIVLAIAEDALDETNETNETVAVTLSSSPSNASLGMNIAHTHTITDDDDAPTVANSTLTASPTSVAAYGVTTSTITMQAKDANNNNLSVGGLTVTMSESGSATLFSVTDVSDGTYTATITSNTVESVTVTAVFGGANLTDTADVVCCYTLWHCQHWRSILECV